MNDKELYKIAKKRVAAKKGFRIHLTVYIMVSILLFTISYTNNHNWWIYPVLGWGIGIVLHFISVFSSLKSENEIQRELENLKKEDKYRG